MGTCSETEQLRGSLQVYCLGTEALTSHPELQKGPKPGVRAGQQQTAGTFSAPGYLTSLPAWSSSWSSGYTAGANGVGGEDKVLLSGLASLPLGLGMWWSIVVST